jgi:hypothetical protein
MNVFVKGLQLVHSIFFDSFLFILFLLSRSIFVDGKMEERRLLCGLLGEGTIVDAKIEERRLLYGLLGEGTIVDAKMKRRLGMVC